MAKFNVLPCCIYPSIWISLYLSFYPFIPLIHLSAYYSPVWSLSPDSGLFFLLNIGKVKVWLKIMKLHDKSPIIINSSIHQVTKSSINRGFRLKLYNSWSVFTGSKCYMPKIKSLSWDFAYFMASRLEVLNSPYIIQILHMWGNSSTGFDWILLFLCPA